MSTAFFVQRTSRFAIPLAFYGALYALTLGSASLQAQKGNISTGPGTGTSRPTPVPLPGRTTDTQNQDPFGSRNQDVFLSGRVALSDGSTPPQSVVIELVCNGSPQPKAYTDSKGRFSFALGNGRTSPVLSDASTSGTTSDTSFGGSPSSRSLSNTTPGMGRAPQQLLGCELRAALAGFRSGSVNLSGHRSLDNPEVGTIVLERIGKVEGFTFSATSSFAPKGARKAYEKGHDLMAKSKWEGAQRSLESAVDEYPKYAVAWFELGYAYQQQNAPDKAVHAYQEALKADSRYLNPYAQLARLSAGQKNWKSSAEYGDELLKLNPYFSPDAYFINAVAHYNLKDLTLAEERVRTALQMDAQHKIPKISQLLGTILLEKRDYPGATQSFNDYLAQAPDAPDAPAVRQQMQEIAKRKVSGEGPAPTKAASEQ